jgi:hypothetical protein
MVCFVIGVCCVVDLEVGGKRRLLCEEGQDPRIDCSRDLPENLLIGRVGLRIECTAVRLCCTWRCGPAGVDCVVEAQPEAA